MPIYEYFCPHCNQEWEAWHTIDERMNEVCCGKEAKQLVSLGTVRPNGIIKEQPKITKHEPFKSQIIKEGKKTIDQSIPNSAIAETNKVIDKMNTQRGYQTDD